MSDKKYAKGYKNNGTGEIFYYKDENAQAEIKNAKGTYDNLKARLDNIDEQYNTINKKIESGEIGGNYELPIATSDTLGGIKVGSGLAISNGVLSSTAGVPTDEQVSSAVNTYLVNNPSATTTVQDGSITEDKLDTNLKTNINKIPSLCEDKFYTDNESNYLFTLADYDMQKYVRKNNDAEKDVCIYAGHYSEYIEVDVNSIKSKRFYVFGDINYSAFNVGLRFVCCFYDENKTFISSSSFDPIFIGLHILRVDLPLNTEFIRFYTTDDVLSEKYIQDLVFYTLPIKGDNINPIINATLNDNFDKFEKENLFPKDNYIMKTGNYSSLYMGTGLKSKYTWKFPIECTENEMYFYYKNELVPISLQNAWRIKGQCSVIACYDENCNYLGTATIEILLNTDTELHFKATLLENTKYINAMFDEVQTNSDTTYLDSKPRCIMSLIPICENPNIDNYSYISSNALDYYCSDFLTDEKNNYLHFKELGRIIKANDSLPYYTCWCHNLMAYDKTTTNFVMVMRGSTAHAGITKNCAISFINDYDFTATDPVNIKIDDNYIQWVRGFWINSDGNYIIIGNLDNDTDTICQFISEDKGSTWTNNGTCTMNTDGESLKFFSMSKVNSGRVFASYDDLVIPVNAQDSDKNYITKLGYSDDDGLTWNVISIPCQFSTVEQFILDIDDNTLMLIGRKNAYPNTLVKAYIGYSTDNGLTWSKLIPSKHLDMHCSDACGFVHDGIVELFCISRYTSTLINPLATYLSGAITHYTATVENAKKDLFLEREKFYSKGVSWSDFTAPACAVDIRGNVLVSYSSSFKNKTSNDRTELYFLYGSKNQGRIVCCDNRPSDVLPYSGTKIDELLNALDNRISVLENK